MKAQLQFNISIRGRQYSIIFKREDTISREDTTSIFGNSVYGRQYSRVRKREDTTSCPLDNSVDSSEHNVVVMSQITSDAV